MECHLHFGPLCYPLENGLDFVRFPQAENSAYRTGGFVQNCILELRGACFKLNEMSNSNRKA